MSWGCGTFRGREMHTVWLWKPEGKRPLGKPRNRWDLQWTIYVMGGYGGNSSGS